MMNRKKHYKSSKSGQSSTHEYLVEHLDLSIFKVHKCTYKKKHNYKQCAFYHTQKDRRRSLDQCVYRPEICPYHTQKKVCPHKDKCVYSHNKVEQAYHPEKYRNKFCVMYPSAIHKCEYNSYCSYAHSEEQVGIELISNYEQDYDFFIFHFKTLFCPFSHVHDRAACVYAHNWQDYRRSPYKYKYSPNPCPFWDPKERISDYLTGCPEGMSCKYCHGEFIQRFIFVIFSIEQNLISEIHFYGFKANSNPFQAGKNTNSILRSTSRKTAPLITVKKENIAL